MPVNEHRFMKIECRMENLPSLLLFAAGQAKEAGFTGKALLQLELATEEIATNIIKYAYPQGSGGLELSCGTAGGGLFEMIFTDQGIPFNPLDRPEPDVGAGLDQRNPGGLGIFLTKRFMDQVNYRREGGRNILALSKRLAQGNANVD
ncbi:MAG: ATP-binding protein [Desulfarculaceae bacterium]